MRVFLHEHAQVEVLALGSGRSHPRRVVGLLDQGGFQGFVTYFFGVLFAFYEGLLISNVYKLSIRLLFSVLYRYLHVCITQCLILISQILPIKYLQIQPSTNK